MGSLPNSRGMAQSPVADRRVQLDGNRLVRRSGSAVFVVGALLWGLGDLFTTHVALGVGAVESNPFARALLVRYGFGALVAAKAGSIVFLVLHRRLLLVVVDWLRPVPGDGHESVCVRVFRQLVEVGYPVSILVYGLVLTTNNALTYVRLAPT